MEKLAGNYKFTKHKFSGRVMLLGPSGSNTELAFNRAYECDGVLFGESFRHVFLAISNGEVDAGFLPLENKFQGPVSETCDLLYEYRGAIRIVDSVLAPIAHALGRLPDASGTIKIICSHEQAIRQCSVFLSENYPQAERRYFESTSKAAEQVALNKITDALVVASPETLLERGFLIVAPEISDAQHNKTRFGLITRAGRQTTHHDFPPTTTLILDPGKDRQGILLELLEIISNKHSLNLTSLHSRPDKRGGVIFHLDLEGSEDDPNVLTAINDLKDYCKRVTGETAEIICCGSYPCESFRENSIKRVLIVGASGVMGRWFKTFLERAGIQVVEAEATDTQSLEHYLKSNTIKNCEAIILSVPMAEIVTAAEVIKPYLLSGQLLIENSSVKEGILTQLETIIPKDIELLGLHTMFGGDAESIKGKNIICIKTASASARSNEFIDLFYKYGAVVSYSTSAEHDEHTAYSQALVQFLLLAFGKTLSEQSSLNSKSFDPFQTPNFLALKNVLERVLRQSDGLLFDMQDLNIHAGSARAAFCESVTQLNEILKSKQSNEYQTLLEAVRRILIPTAS